MKTTNAFFFEAFDRQDQTRQNSLFCPNERSEFFFSEKLSDGRHSSFDQRTIDQVVHSARLFRRNGRQISRTFSSGTRRKSKFDQSIRTRYDISLLVVRSIETISLKYFAMSTASTPMPKLCLARRSWKTVVLV